MGKVRVFRASLSDDFKSVVNSYAELDMISQDDFNGVVVLSNHEYVQLDKFLLSGENSAYFATEDVNVHSTMVNSFAEKYKQFNSDSDFNTKCVFLALNDYLLNQLSRTISYLSSKNVYKGE